MGEATYYILAQFDSVTTAKTAFHQFRKLNRQGSAAHDWWQEHRGMADRTAFFNQFNATFPLVAEYLGEHSLDHHNGLAGMLDFIDEEGEGSMELDGLEISGSACVWHFADWGRMAEWLETQGANKVEWLSDEDLDPMELLRSRMHDPANTH